MIMQDFNSYPMSFKLHKFQQQCKKRDKKYMIPNFHLKQQRHVMVVAPPTRHLKAQKNSAQLQPHLFPDRAGLEPYIRYCSGDNKINLYQIPTVATINLV